jgi:hypothetical protein
MALPLTCSRQPWGTYLDQGELYIEVFPRNPKKIEAAFDLYLKYLKPVLGYYLAFDQKESRPIWHEASLETVEGNELKLATFTDATKKVAASILGALRKEQLSE